MIEGFENQEGPMADPDSNPEVEAEYYSAESQAEPDSDSSHKLNKGQKIGLVFLVVFVIGLSVAMVFQFKKNLIVPIAGVTEKESSSEQEKNKEVNQGGQEVTVEDLKNQDTDQDGLSDYQELNVYNTSPYLSDTDSDGLLDKQEIDNSTDPNCPKGQVCSGFYSGETSGTGETGGTGASVGDSSVVFSIDDLTADQLRALLLESGQIGQADLDALDDETLLVEFKGFLNDNPEMKAELEKSLAESSQASTPTSDTVINPNNYKAEDLRKALIDSGMSADEVNLFSDQELVELYEGALDKVQ